MAIWGGCELASGAVGPGLLLMAKVVPFLLVGAILLRRLAEERRGRLRAYTFGRAIWGRTMATDAGPRPSVTWEYEVNGTRYTGQLAAERRELLEPYLSSTQVLVLYDEGWPAESTLYLP